MSFSGDLSSLGLADVFQNISLNNQSGTLIVTQDRKRKCIYFSEGHVAFAVSTETKDLKIGELLLRAKLINPKDLETGMKMQQSAGGLLGRILIELGFVTDAHIKAAISQQMEEEVHELFLWDHGTFEFQDGPPNPDIFSPQQLAENIRIPANSLIMEAARRSDEWEMIYRIIQSDKQIFIQTEKAADSLAQYGEDDLDGIVLALVDGSRNVEDLAKTAYMTRFEIGKTLAAHVQAGNIRPLNITELKRLAKGLRGLGQLEKTIDVYEWVLEQQDNDMEAHAMLADTLEEAGYLKQSAAAYVMMGEQQESAGRLDNAIMAYEKATALAADMLQAHQHLFEIYRHQQRRSELVQETKRLLLLYRREEQTEKIRRVCQLALDVVPDQLEFRQTLADVYRELGNHEDAISEYETLAEAYLVLGQKDKVEEVYRHILSLNSRRRDIRRKLKDLHIDHRARKRKRIKLLKKLAVMSLLLCVAALLAYTEYQSMRAYGRLATQANALAQQGAFLEAASLLETFAKDKRYFFLEAGKAQNLADEMRRKHQVKQAEHESWLVERGKEIQTLLEGVRAVWEGGDPDRALQEVQTLMDGFTEEEMQLEAVQQAAGMVTAIEAYIRNSAALAARAQKAEEDGRIEDASRLYQELIKVFPNSRLARNARVPIRIVTNPKGASVRMNGEPIGTSPLISHWRYGGKFTVEASRETYKPSQRVLDPEMHDVPAVITLTMAKNHVWRYETRQPIQCSPVGDGNNLYFGGRDGKVYCVRCSDGRLLWSQTTGALGDIQGTPLIAGDNVLIGAYDGMVYSMNKQNGHKNWTYDTAHMIKGSPVRYNEYALIIGSTSGWLYLLRHVDGQPRWRFDAGARIDGTAAVSDTRVYVGTEAGTLYALEGGGKGKLLWTFQAGGPLLSTPAIHGETLYIGSDDGLLYAVDKNTGEGLWTFPTGGPVRGKPFVARHRVIITSQDGYVYAIPENSPGRESWKFKAGGNFEAGVVAYRDMVYAACMDGRLYALTIADGSLQWIFVTGGAILSAPTVFQGLLYVASDDNAVYAIQP